MFILRDLLLFLQADALQPKCGMSGALYILPKVLAIFRYNHFFQCRCHGFKHIVPIS